METPRETYDALFEEVVREIPPQPEQRQLMDKAAWSAEQKALREELAGEVLAKQEIVPVQITPPAGAEGSGGYDPEEVSL